MFETEQKIIEDQVKAYLTENGLPETEIQWAWIPFSGNWGMATSFFQLAAQDAKAKGVKMNVGQHAQEIAQGIADRLQLPVGFERAEAVRGYLNLYFSTKIYSQRVIDEVLMQKDEYGRGAATGERVMVEFSQPNTHKAFHVGHLRNVILGNSICNILEKAGDEVIRANYLGDIGLHVIKWMWCYLKYHNGEEPGEDITRWMGDLYAESDRRHHDEPDADAEIRALFARWDRRDQDVVDLWKKTRQWSLDGFDDIYKELGVRFDHLYFESEVEDSGKVIVDELIEKGIATDERPEGAVVVKLDDILGTKEKYRVLVVLRSDGTSLYATKDLSLAIKKFEQFNLTRSIYVIDVRQSLYMQQIFKTMELMGYPWTKNLYHLAYEIVNLPGNVTMSSRDGTVVFLQDLLSEATARALQIVDEKNPDLPGTGRCRGIGDPAVYPCDAAVCDGLPAGIRKLAGLYPRPGPSGWAEGAAGVLCGECVPGRHGCHTADALAAVTGPDQSRRKHHGTEPPVLRPGQGPDPPGALCGDQ